MAEAGEDRGRGPAEENGRGAVLPARCAAAVVRVAAGADRSSWPVPAVSAAAGVFDGPYIAGRMVMGRTARGVEEMDTEG